MIKTLDSRTLTHGALLRIDHPAGGRIGCLAGRLWITVDGDPCDQVLERGDSFAAQGAAPIVVYALADSVLQSELAVEGPRTPLRRVVASWLRRGRIAAFGRTPCEGA